MLPNFIILFYQNVGTQNSSKNIFKSKLNSWPIITLKQFNIVFIIIYKTIIYKISKNS